MPLPLLAAGLLICCGVAMLIAALLIAQRTPVGKGTAFQPCRTNLE